MREFGRWLGAALICVTAAACTHTPPVLPAAAPSAPHYPDFVFPAAQSTSDVAAAHQAAWDTLQSGDARGAERQYAALLKRAPDFYPAEVGLGYAALARKDAQAAVAHFDKALAANAQYAPALAGKGDALLSIGQADAALAAFEAALAANPSLTGLKTRVDLLRFHDVQQQIAAARKAADAGQLDEARRAYQAAISASPESAFLYRELAAVDRRAGNADAAIADARKAVSLDPSDGKALLLIAEVYESGQQWTEAADAYAAANLADPSDATATKIEEMQARAAFETMPPEYRAIESAPIVTRAQLAALIGTKLEDLLRRARPVPGTVVTDARSNWAAPWILAVTRAGVMDVYPNHTFQPSGVVRRSDLAAAVSRILTIVAADKPKLAARWRDPHPNFPDVAPTHFGYPAAARAVSAGIMEPLLDGSFGLTHPVTGAEAFGAVSKLVALAKK